ncbi:hypothetical protein JXA02_07785 [candidate division KSB1 bacterium]|nr:hypothetical protein [candidate division KSB1 bacterium]RQW06245.1 MAG: hypothetical protein EH222_09045 [candidate division KSB1 bacterium]
MMRNKKQLWLYPLLAVALMFSMCTTGYDSDYSNWYNENPEEDLLTTLVSEEATESDVQSAGDKWDSWYEETGGPVETETPAKEDSLSPESNSGKTAIDREKRLTMKGGNVPEFRSGIIKEKKMASQNRIELTIANKVRKSTDSDWRAFSNANVSLEDNKNLQIVSMDRQTDAKGEFKITLAPKEPFMYFSFVPLEKAGFEPYNYSVPVEALDLNTITFNLQTAEGVWYNYRYSYQIYDVRPVIASFINMEINSRTRPVTINIYGTESRHPVEGAKVTLKGTPPTRIRLISKYFKDIDLLKYALSVAPDYTVSSEFVYSNLTGAQMRMYYPYDYTLEVSHPDYFFTAKQVQVTADTKTVDFYLDRLYTNAKVVQTSSAE